MIATYLFIFCRVVVGLVFVLSLGGKCRDLQGFRRTILNFRVLPDRFSSALMVLFLGGESMVAVGVIIGGALLLPAFVLAGLLLLLFSAAMVSVLIRKLSTSCHCFGKSDHPISAEDLWRNGGFFCCALGGCAMLLWVPQVQRVSEGAIWLLSGAAATVFVLVWLQLRDIVVLFKQ